MPAEIQSSVGYRGANRPDDVIIVQRLLMQRGLDTGGADGQCGRRTLASIRTFQTGFLRNPDGRIDPGGTSWRRLVGSATAPVPPVTPPAPADGTLTRLLPRPDRSTMNPGLVAVSNRYMTEKLGNPRNSYTQDCQSMTNERLKRHVVTRSVGPFRVTGLRPAVDSLQTVLDEVNQRHREVYTALGTAGMLCCRLVRGSTSSISNHAWGTAIDLKLNGLLDRRGDNNIQYGLALIAPIFNRHGWYWGAAFRTEDAMHFEASQSLIEAWAPALGA
ncbi:M15 family metallopeptidase [Aquabacterium sp. A7-Y]|uniref:M15 family metallopeptidase n=1 Tax=Aquabacterium sp. A7-Y TaxID=1349605 RepID=UPI00223CA288|nr:M15 family metallopeptidase [Aquabacterium sp. A7-Y]MCW7540752.1 M15 family metallopeptidase [Aquabacterium sp. A7-Y]